MQTTFPEVEGLTSRKTSQDKQEFMQKVISLKYSKLFNAL